MLTQGSALSVAVALSGIAKATIAAATPTPVSRPRRWIHPGIFQRQQDLEFMCAQVAAGRDPWKAAWDRMLSLPTSSLDFTPQPVTHIVRGSYGAGQNGDREINASIESTESHVLQWVVTGKEVHAQKAASIIEAWSSVLGDFSGNDAMLVGGWSGGKWANLAEILRATWKNWPAASIHQFETMLRTVYVPLLYPLFPEANGNWDAAMMHSLLAISVFSEDQALLDHGLGHYRLGPGNGGITRYIYPNGQCEESTRDQAHTQLGLGYFALASLIAWNQNIDLFYEADNRLALGFEYTSRYMLGEPVFSYGAISDQTRGRFDDWYEVPLQHFRFDRGISMPYTEQAAAQALPRSHSVLTMFRGQGPAQPLHPPPVPSRIALEAGAALQPQPVPVVAIQPGQSIQDALSKADALNKAGQGGTVALAAGLHVLSQSLVMPSGTTLLGVGRDTVLFLDPKQSGPAIINADLQIHDVAIRNLLIEAGTLPKPTRDPNQDRRPLATQLVPARGGIAFVTDAGKPMRRITLDHVSVRDATLSAVEIFGADGVKITACDFSASGGAVAPGPGKLHCLKLTHVSNASISGSRVADSFHGSGVAIAFGQAVTIQDCEVARNKLDGVNLTDCQLVTLEGCLLEGNGSKAIGEPAWASQGTHLKSSNNILRNNGGDR
jgi:hypothetical protein